MGWGKQAAFLQGQGMLLTSHRLPPTCRGCHSSEGLRLRRRWRAPTFAVLPVAGVAGLADALVGLGGVLADGVDVAVVGALHALVDICKGRGGGSDGESRGAALPVSPREPLPEAMKPSSPPAFQPAHEPERLEGATLLLCSLVASPHPAMMQRVMGSLWDTVSGWGLSQTALPVSLPSYKPP